jgi:hypothetical protein
LGTSRKRIRKEGNRKHKKQEWWCDTQKTNSICSQEICEKTQR